MGRRLGWVGNYPANPWWWWTPAAFTAAAAFVDLVTPEPVYVDYGMNVVYEDDTVYADNQPIPTEQYSQPVIDLALNVEQPPPPAASPDQTPAATEQPEVRSVAKAAEEWLPLGVFALAQEEKGDAVMFFQIFVNREGFISGDYQSYSRRRLPSRPGSVKLASASPGALATKPRPSSSPASVTSRKTFHRS